MKKMVLRTLVLLLVIATFINLRPIHAFALSCAEIPSVEAAYEKYDGIIVGQVNKVIRKNEHNEIQLTIIRSFKGINEGKITMKEDAVWGNLNGPSEVGVEYLYFLKVIDDEWENQLCSPSIKVSEASDEIEFLKDKEIPLKVDPLPNESTSEEIGLEGTSFYDSTLTENDSAMTETNLKYLLAIAIFVVVCLIALIIYGFMRKR